MKIFKYELEITDRQTIKLPGAWHIRSVANQNGKLCLWAEVEPGKAEEDVHILIVGTGNPYSTDRIIGFVGTVVIDPFVWHVFIESGK